MRLLSLLSLCLLVSLTSPTLAQDLTQKLLQNAPNASNTPGKKEPPKLSSPEPGTAPVLVSLALLARASRTIKRKKCDRALI